jgi:arginine transport system substrate-binding protein
MIKKIAQIGLLVLMSIMSQLSLAALPQTVRVATNPAYPPFESINSNGEIEGFDIDVMNAVCRQMKVTCAITGQPWDSLIPSLQLGKFDAIISAMNITDERKKEVDFTDAYYVNTMNFLGETTKKVDISTAGLKGKVVGVLRGTTAQYFLQAEYPQVKLKTYANQLDSFLDFTSGRIDIVLADTPVVLGWLKENNTANKYAVFGGPISDIKHVGPGYGIALKKENSELLAAFNKALAEIKANGDYEKIMRKYF